MISPGSGPGVFLLRRLVARRCTGRETADIEQRAEQFGFRQDRLRLCNHARGRMLAVLDMVMQQGLDLGHALADREHVVTPGAGRPL
jgi:hypothetical protein